MKRFVTFTGLLLASAPLVSADTTILNETFDYADQAAYAASWLIGSDPSLLADPTDPNAIAAFPPPILDDSGSAAFHPGHAAGIVGDSVTVWSGLTSANAVSASNTQSLRLSVDIYADIVGNKTMTLGLRNATNPDSILEMGFLNQQSIEFAHRAVLFNGAADPGWQFFQLDPALDRTDDADDITTIADIGAGWHTYTATITPSTITFDLDLFRDGLDNGATVTAGSDTAGLDASVTYNIDTSTDTFDNLRFGGPSGSPSPGGGVLFDNILLELIDAVAGITGDYNGSGQVEQGDLDLVLQNWGDDTGATGIPAGWTNDNTNLGQIEQTELDRVLQNWGSTSAPDFAGSAVPEPATLALLSLGGLAMLRRRA